MALKRILATILLTTLVGGTSGAQAVPMGDVTVTSTPTGAMATLSGEAVVTGVTPARFRHLLIGDYRLDVKMHGYEDYSTRVALDPARPLAFNVTLTPKTRFKSALRSMVIPGWGQRYSGQRFKAYTFGLFSIAAGVAVLITDNNFDDEFDHYQERMLEYDVATSYEEQRRLYPGLVEARNDAYDSENTRRIAMGVAIGVWGVNLLDALLFHPSKPEGFRIKGMTLAPTANAHQVGLSLVTRF